MTINKLHDEFHTLDMDKGWEVPAGYPSGIQQKILAGALDEVGKRGSRTRLLRFDPGRLYDSSLRARLLGRGFPGQGRPDGRQ